MIYDSDLDTHAPFAAPNSDIEEALRRWQDIWQQTTFRQEVNKDIKMAKEAIKSLFDKKEWDKIEALKVIKT